MANQKVLSSSNCGCACTDEDVASSPVGNPVDLIVVRSKAGIEIGNKINEYNEGGKKIYELDDYVVVEPVVALSNDYPLIEVGRTIALVTFVGSITPGTLAISSRSISPDPGGLVLTAPFNFTKANVKRTTPGVTQLHTLTAEDIDGNSVSVSSQVTAKNAFFQGSNGSATLTQAQIKALANKHLIDSILQEYGGSAGEDYTIGGAVPLYQYWAGPVGSPQIGSATLNGFALPLVEVGPIVVENIHDAALTVSYWVKRTANKLNPGTYKIILS